MDIGLAVKPGIEVPRTIVPPTRRVEDVRGTLMLWLDKEIWNEKDADCRSIMNFLGDLVTEDSTAYRYCEVNGDEDDLISGGWVDNPFCLQMRVRVCA